MVNVNQFIDLKTLGQDEKYEDKTSQKGLMEEKIAVSGRNRVSDNIKLISVLWQWASWELSKGSPRTENARTDAGGKGEGRIQEDSQFSSLRNWEGAGVIR